MRFLVFGAGAIGGLIGGRLGAAGYDVMLIARGAQLAALRQQGLCLVDASAARRLRLPASADPRDFPDPDYVILAVKAHGLEAALETLAPVIAHDSVLVAAQNGIPWWYNHGLEGPRGGQVLRSVDPQGRLWEGLPPSQVIGCVVYAAAAVPEPGRVSVTLNGEYVLGEPDGRDSERLRRLADVFAAAGLPSRVSPRIRDEIWLKLWGNIAFNTASLLTAASVRQMIEDAGVARVLKAMMAEAEAVGRALGIRFAMSLPERYKLATRLGDFRTSSLQDLEAGRRVELAALIGAVLELAREAGVATPTLDTVHALARLRIACAGCL